MFEESSSISVIRNIDKECNSSLPDGPDGKVGERANRLFW